MVVECPKIVKIISKYKELFQFTKFLIVNGFLFCGIFLVGEITTERGFNV